jgi:hypothetical protein
VADYFSQKRDREFVTNAAGNSGPERSTGLTEEEFDSMTEAF